MNPARVRTPRARQSLPFGTNAKVTVLVIIALGACVTSILLGAFFSTLGQRSNRALFLTDRVDAAIQEINLLEAYFIQNADEASWTDMTHRMRSAQADLRELLTLTQDRPREIGDLAKKIESYQSIINRLFEPVMQLNAQKTELQKSGLSFTNIIDRALIDPFRAEEGLRIYAGLPIDPFKARVKDEATSLRGLYQEQQILLLGLLQDLNLVKYKLDRASIAADIAQHNAQLTYMGILIGKESDLQPVFDLLSAKIAALLNIERMITGLLADILSLDKELDNAGAQLSLAKGNLVAVINAEIEQEAALNRLANILLLTGIVASLAVFGVLLGRDVIRFVRHLEVAHRNLTESELRFRTVIEQAADAIILSDFSGAVIEVNRRACDLLGYTREELLALNLRDLADGDAPPPWTQAVAGEPVTLETGQRRKDGSVFPAEIRIGHIVYAGRDTLLGIARDITERKRAEAALQLSEENLRITLDSIGDGVIATDIHGNVVRMNRVAEQLTGVTLAGARGRALKEIFHIINTETRQEAEDPVERVLKENKIVEIATTTTLVAADDREYRIADSGAPIQNERGEIFGVVLIFRDVTEQHRLQEKLRHSEKMDAIGQLAGGIAHDFNNMLTGIIGTADLMAPLVADQSDLAESIGLILNTATRAADLTQKLLSFSRKGRVLSASFDLHDCIDSALAILERSIDKTIVIERRFAALSPSVTGDATQLENAFLNLGINARDAMPHGGRLSVSTGNVDLDEDYCRHSAFTLAPGRHVRVRVGDTGVGMDRKILERIFEPFFTTKSGERGTGLGLASVYGAVKEHGGDIQVESEPGKGTVFTIHLPAGKTGAPETARELETIRPLSGVILIVDDEEIVRSSLERFFRDSQFTVLTAGDGEEALAVYRREKDKIDVILLDLVMPRKSGRDTFYELKAINPAARIIVSSGFAHDTNVMALIQDGASAFIQKPYRFRELMKLIGQVMV
jgi:PAS domain S-box-containing protein